MTTATTTKSRVREVQDRHILDKLDMEGYTVHICIDPKPEDPRMLAKEHNLTLRNEDVDAFEHAEVYGYVVVKDGKLISEGWGYYGDDGHTGACESAGESIYNHLKQTN